MDSSTVWTRNAEREERRFSALGGRYIARSIERMDEKNEEWYVEDSGAHWMESHRNKRGVEGVGISYILSMSSNVCDGQL